MDANDNCALSEWIQFFTQQEIAKAKYRPLSPSAPLPPRLRSGGNDGIVATHAAVGHGPMLADTRTDARTRVDMDGRGRAAVPLRSQRSSPSRVPTLKLC